MGVIRYSYSDLKLLRVILSGHGSLFGSFRVLFLVCWFGQISFCSIEPGFEVLDFHMVSLV